MPCSPAWRASNLTWISPMMSVLSRSGVDLAGEAGQRLGLAGLLRAVAPVRGDQSLMHPPERVVDLVRLLLEGVVDLDERVGRLAAPAAHHGLDLRTQVRNVTLDLGGGVVDLGGALRHRFLTRGVLSHGSLLV